ncbi:hypothetical protein AB0L06_08885 [Spirillospora sp. NPDC052269]
MTTPSGLTSPFPSRRPAAAYDDLLARVLPQAREQRMWSPSDGPMPSLFVSHGAPFTLDDPQWLGDLFDWARSIPEPRAIVVVSAHWEQAPVAISGAAADIPVVQMSMPGLALTDYRAKAPGAAVAHPTADHFVPLLLAVGAADDPGSAVTAIDRMVMGNSTRSVQLT